jgi:amino acid adenylation domain-containing protein
MTTWLRGPDLDDGTDLWESVDAALDGYGTGVPVVHDPASGASLSAAGLRRRVEQAAAALAAAGARTGDCVVIDLERCVDEVVCVLACVRQGVAYVGTSTDTPVSAHAAVIEDAVPAAVVTHRPEQWPGLLTMSTSDLDGGSPSVPPPSRSAEVCYVSYTSGTTGRPRGVESPRAGVDRLMRGADYCRLASGDRILRFAPLAFDASTFELFVGLWRHATIVVGPRGPLDLDVLADFLVTENIDVCWLTSGLFSSLIDYRVAAFARLRQVLTGGDRVSAASVSQLLQRFPDLLVVNGYGPTEATTFATVRPVSRTDLPLTSVPIGRPIAGTEVGLSTEGEILIAGRGLAVGYRNDPVLTAERFPVTRGRRVYHTGDLGEIVNGELHFRGRRDRQLKVRGFRVEPSAVDETLIRHRLVAESWTFAHRGSAGTEVVCAFVAGPGTPGSTRVLRRSLSDHGLPEYAVPHRFVEVSAIPLTPNGKVDEAALSVETRLGEASSTASDVPARAAAADVADLDFIKIVRRSWAQAIGASDFDEHSGFFDSGGDSLRLAKLHAMLQDTFPEAELRLVDLLMHPSVAEQAAFLHAKIVTVRKTAV